MGASAQQILQSDPEFIQRQLQAQEMQRVNPTGGAAGAIGALLGRGLGNVTQGRGFFEPSNPGLKRVTDVQNIMKSVQFDPNNPSSYYQQVGSALLESGYADLAPMAFEEARKFTKTETSAFAKIDPKDYTPESVKAFAQTGDYGSLIPRDKPGASYRTLTAAETRARGLDPRMTYQLEEGTNKVTQIGQGPSVVFNAPLVGAENAYSKEVGDARAKRDISQFGAAEAATENLVKLNDTLNELKTGEAFTGSFAEIQKNIQKVQAKFAADKKAGKRVSDTEILDALLGSDVFPMIGALGIGARGLDTIPEREYMRQVLTGTISLERDTLIRMTEIRKNIAERAINKFNSRVDKGEFNDFFKYQGMKPQKFEIPKFEPPTPAPPAAPQQGGRWSIEKVKK
jgi:hypothetical protein